MRIGKQDALYLLTTYSDADLLLMLNSIADDLSKRQKGLFKKVSSPTLLNDVRRLWELLTNDQISQEKCDEELKRLLIKSTQKETEKKGEEFIPAESPRSEAEIALRRETQAWVGSFEDAEWLTEIEKQALMSMMDVSYPKNLIQDLNYQGVRMYRRMAMIKIKIREGR